MPRAAFAKFRLGGRKVGTRPARDNNDEVRCPCSPSGWRDRGGLKPAEGERQLRPEEVWGGLYI